MAKKNFIAIINKDKIIKEEVNYKLYSTIFDKIQPNIM